MPDDFEARLVALAERTMRIKAHCAGEDATRIYLVMPFIELLGYDARDPSLIVPEHDEAVDFAIMTGGKPTIAIEATGAAHEPRDTYARLRSYCAEHPTVKLALATNGAVFEAFIDSQRPDELDADPFVRLDLADVAAGRLDRQALDYLRMMRAVAYDPEALAEQVYAISLRDKLKALILDEFRNPSEPFCRLMLEKIGIKSPKVGAIDQHYRRIVRGAMEQAIIVPVLQALRRLPAPTPSAAMPVAEPEIATAAAKIQPVQSETSARQRSSIGERFGDELAAFGRAKRRSA